jgi:hypothetical protein
MQTASRRRHAFDPLLWYAVTAPPLAWSGHLLISYLLVSTACSAGTGWMRVMIGALTIAVEATIVAAGVAGYARWRPTGDRLESDDRDEGRASFMGYVGMLESAIFFIATLFTAAHVFFLTTCS